MAFFFHRRPGRRTRASLGVRAWLMLLIVLGSGLGLGATYRSSAAPLAAAPELAESPRLTPAATTMWNWQTMAPAPQARFEAQGAAANGKLYVIGGFYTNDTKATNLVDVYDPDDNTWQRIANIPEPITHAPVVVDGNTLYVLGGYVGDNPGGSTNHVWKLDTTTNTWSAGPSLPAGRGGGGAAIVNRRIYFFGGATRTAGQFNDTDQPDHWVLDLNLPNPTWQSLAALPNPRNHMAGVALNGKIYAIGGQHNKREEDTNQAQVDIYDPASNTWSRAADMPIPKGHTGASTFVVNGRIMVIGGSINGGTNGIASDDVLLYDPPTNVWLKLPPIPGIRKTPVADLIGDRIIVSTGGGYYQTNTTWSVSWPNTWETGATMPAALGEVAGGIIGNYLYLVGESSAATLRYNLSTNSYSSTAALPQRPFIGNHHAAEVISGKLYLFGGLGASGAAAGKVQIFDPATKQWSLGADMPFAAGSSSSALIGGQVYVAGGIVNFSTTTRMARYNPATNSWTELAPMPQGRNHAAAATDGSKLYVFGGRGPGSGDDNVPANGFDTVQIYDPASNTWRSSLDAGSTLAPLPQARGGMGRAVYFNGEFYVLGGETLDGAGANANDVYDRVDIYNPTTNTWRRGTPLPSARHGIFPLLIGQRIYVAGGGTSAAGGSNSSILEIYNPGRPEPAPFVEQNGRVVMEAEHYHEAIVRDKAWVPHVNQPGFLGQSAMIALTNTGATTDTNYVNLTPEMRYRVLFNTPGTYYVWARGWADNGNDNSFHAGLNGVGVSSGARISMPTASFSSWAWFNRNTSLVSATLVVATPGIHTVNIWMREDGMMLDRFLLTTDAGLVPIADGPGESPQHTPTASVPPTATAITPTASATATAITPTATATATAITPSATATATAITPTASATATAPTATATAPTATATTPTATTPTATATTPTATTPAPTATTVPARGRTVYLPLVMND